jgi:hypothetical protein
MLVDASFVIAYYGRRDYYIVSTVYIFFSRVSTSFFIHLFLYISHIQVILYDSRNFTMISRILEDFWCSFRVLSVGITLSGIDPLRRG